MGKSPRPTDQHSAPVGIKDGTLCSSLTQLAKPAGDSEAVSDKNIALLDDQDLSVSRTISTGSKEFLSNYVDNNIQSVEYWDTPYAKEDSRFDDFVVVYEDSRRLNFRLGQIPARFSINTRPGKRMARIAMAPRKYVKRGGFIYPEFYGEGSTPRLIDVATTIEFNHRQREKFLEVATLTFTFAMILTAYVTPPEVPEATVRTPRAIKLPGLKPQVRRVTWQNLAEWEQLELEGSGGRIARKLREGGHLLGQHVEISESALQARAPTLSSKIATKFTDADVAVNAVNRTLEKNWRTVQSFLSKLKTGEAEFLEISAQMDKPVGFGYQAMANGTVTRVDGLRDVVVWVQADGVGGWLVRTAHPVP